MDDIFIRAPRAQLAEAPLLEQRQHESIQDLQERVRKLETTVAWLKGWLASFTLLLAAAITLYRLFFWQPG